MNRTTYFNWFAVALLAATLPACSNMSGLDANNQFACKAPDGILCESMSGIYANAQAKNLPGQRVGHGSGRPSETGATVSTGVLTRPIESGTPIRSAPRLLRVWFAPWEDSDGDLHDQSYVYLPVDTGRWLIEHNRRRIQDAYRPIRSPTNAHAPVSQATPSRPTTHPANLNTPAEAPLDGNGVNQARMGAAHARELMGGLFKPTEASADE
jgi:conjugal transfer pilus assembly protein TraV